MPKTIKTRIDRWNGGLISDSRDPRENTARLIQNFDVSTNPTKMTPFRSSVDGDSAASTSKKQNFTLALRTGTTYSLYGLGVTSGGTKAEIQYKDLTTGAANDLDDNVWTNTGNHQGSAMAATTFDLFAYYRKTGRIYGARDGTHIWAYDPAGTVAMNESERAITYTNIVQGLVHSLDDILYIPYDNKIATNDNGAWVDAALTLPANYKISCISEYGVYLAIALVDRAGVGNSKVVLWNRQPGTSFLSDSLDFGEGQLKILEQVEGVLIGISVKEGVTGNVSIFQEKFIFRYYTPGSGVVTFQELLGAIDFPVITVRQKSNNRLYFCSVFTINGTVRAGLWSVGRAGQGWSVIHERSHDNDTSGSGVLMYGFIMVGDYIFMAYNTGSAFAVTKTNSAATYAHNSIYEGKRWSAGSASDKKDLKGITLETEFLPSSSSVFLLYRTDENTSYTEIMKHATQNAISRSAVVLHNRTSGGDVVTMTIANPCDVTLAAHGLIAGQRIRFSTSGSLPTGGVNNVVAGTTYYVLSAGISSSVFRFSLTDGGTAIDTTGATQSGTHKVDRSFPLPKGYKEIEYKLVSTGGAEVVALEWEESITGQDKPY